MNAAQTELDPEDPAAAPSTLDEIAGNGLPPVPAFLRLLKVARLWHGLGRLDMAAACADRARALLERGEGFEPERMSVRWGRLGLAWRAIGREDRREACLEMVAKSRAAGKGR